MAFQKYNRLNIYLTARQRALLGREAARLEVSITDLVRRILDGWLDARGIGS